MKTTAHKVTEARRVTFLDRWLEANKSIHKNWLAAIPFSIAIIKAIQVFQSWANFMEILRVKQASRSKKRASKKQAIINLMTITTKRTKQAIFWDDPFWKIKPTAVAAAVAKQTDHDLKREEIR